MNILKRMEQFFYKNKFFSHCPESSNAAIYDWMFSIYKAPLLACFHSNMKNVTNSCFIYVAMHFKKYHFVDVLV